MQYDSFMCMPWLIHMCDMAHLYVCHDASMSVTWLMHRCDVTHSCVWHDSCICGTWLIHLCDMTHSYVWHDSLICVMTHSWLIHMCDVTDTYTNKPHLCAWGKTRVYIPYAFNLNDMHMGLVHVNGMHMGLVYIDWFWDSIFRTNCEFVETLLAFVGIGTSLR